MAKVKNVQSGIVIIADAGIKMGPGDVVEVNNLTPQAQRAIDDGLITRVDMEPESKGKAKPSIKIDDQSPVNSKQSDSQSAKPESGDKNGAG